MLCYFVRYGYLPLDQYLIEGEDYEELNTTVTLVPGQPLVTNITAGIVDDQRLEQLNESCLIQLEIVERPSSGTINLASSQANVIIQDDDGWCVQCSYD